MLASTVIFGRARTLSRSARSDKVYSKHCIHFPKGSVKVISDFPGTTPSSFWRRRRVLEHGRTQIASDTGYSMLLGMKLVAWT